MKTTYQQCLLVKGSRAMVTWIPTQFAEKGKHLKLCRDQTTGCIEAYTEWEDGWMVLTNYGKQIDETELSCIDPNQRTIGW